ncbi:conserved hypothetical protein [Thermosulfidibacter takaii ABI70S6]|uniref:Chorismate dehydratase n=1 Tax=Thermosulfidibacter takaii (strain DSM 17441 / JCM 13301 / NBRC 103674 / ABI70S6) TaxID=1298851 RepID=A0A0S3QUH1_THET7|nr:menaquinone biosynthesis protein [Thermosulfidibacter takaii]BAT71959.1 conserved hypothetical protein [Thermosulfidibacter takaii ABI70S6]
MLRLGIISYLNTLPVYYGIERGLVKLPDNVEVVKGVPTQLNRMLANGEIDMAVVSAFEYAQHYRDYLVLPQLCIGADGEVRSVLFFSTVPMEELDGREVYLTRASLTSKNLLMYIFKKRGIVPVYKEFVMEDGIPNNGYMGILLIGDDSLRMLSHNKFAYVYDLAELWKTEFGTPFVFALWCVRREAYLRCPSLVKEVWERLIESKRVSRQYYPQIAEEKARELGLSVKECLNYLNILHFDLAPAFVEGMKLFFEEMARVKLLKEVPEIEFANC